MKTNNVKEQLKKVIDNLDETKLLEVLSGLTSKINRPLDYKDIKTFSDACDYLEIDDSFLNLLSSINNKNSKSVIAQYKLSIVYEAINKLNNWVPNFTDSNQYKYYPHFKLFGSGFGFSGAYYYCDYAFTCVGVRLCTYSREVAEYIGKTFIKEYEDYLM